MSSIIKYKHKDGLEAYRIYYWDHTGKRKSQVIVGKKRTAVATLRRLDVKNQDIRNGIVPSPIGILNTSELVRTYLNDLSKSATKASTVKRYSTSLSRFLEQLSVGKTNQVGKISYSDIERYKSHRLETCTNAGVNIDLRTLRTFFNYCVRMDFIASSPYDGVKQVKEGAIVVRFLSGAEIHALIQVIKAANDEDMLDIVHFYLNTGARANEILAPTFTWDRVKPEFVELFGKGDKTRRIGLNDTLRTILDKRRHLDYAFPFKYDYVYSRIVRKYYHRVGIEGADLHSLRKTAGALLIQQGVDIYRVSRFLGHSSVTVTERHYVDLLQSDFTTMSQSIEIAISKTSEPRRNTEGE